MEFSHAEREGVVQWAEIAPGDGYRYSGFVSHLPASVEGGGIGSHVLVTLYEPNLRRSYVLSTVDTLMPYYVQEKFEVPENRMSGVMQLLQVLLPDREVIQMEDVRD